MNQELSTQPTECDRCGDSLEGCYSTRYRQEGDNVVVDEVFCTECRLMEGYKSYLETRIISGGLMMDLAVGSFDAPGKRLLENKRPLPQLVEDWRRVKEVREELTAFRDKIDLKTREFEGGVWFDAGLQKFIHAQTKSGLSAHFRKWEGFFNNPTYTGFEMDVRCFSTAGRFLITFEATHEAATDDPKPGTNVTFITEEDSRFHRMGWQSLYGTASDILALCDVAIHHWGQAHYAQMLKEGESIDFGLTPDGNVSVL